MHNVFAKFDSKERAENARLQILSRVDGIDRAGTRMIIPPHAEAEHNPGTAGAIASTVTHEASVHHDQCDVMHAARQQAEYNRRTGYEPIRGADYMLCAQGSPEAVSNAARILENLGGQNIGVRDSSGDFLSGQPPIK